MQPIGYGAAKHKARGTGPTASPQSLPIPGCRLLRSSSFVSLFLFLRFVFYRLHGLEIKE